MIFYAPDIVALMKTPTDACKDALVYVVICSAGIPFITAFNVTAAVFRGMGNSTAPMFVVAIACMINILGDFLLAGFFGLGVTGVAIATFSAQLISSVCEITIMKKHGFPFIFRRSHLVWKKDPVKMILFTGLPIALQDTLINISFIILTVIANLRGLAASSAVGIVEKVIMFMFLVPTAMLSSISAITAQNTGAGKPERAKIALKFGIFLTILFGALMCSLSWICPQAFTNIFAKDASVLAEANQYLKTYSIDCILVGFTFCVNGYLCGISKSFVPFIHNTVSIFFVRVPSAYFLSSIFPNSMLPMGLASPLGSLLSIIILSVYLAVSYKKQNTCLYKKEP